MGAHALIESGCPAKVLGDRADLCHGLRRGTEVTVVGLEPFYRDERVWVVQTIDGNRFDVAERDLEINPKLPPNAVKISPGVVLLRGEVHRETSETGGQKDAKLARYDQIPTVPLRLLAERYGMGNAKYPVGPGEVDNWRKGYSWSLSYAALQRHLNAFWAGEDIDAETGQPHLIAAAWHCFTLTQWSLDPDMKKFDDRQDPKGGAR